MFLASHFKPAHRSKMFRSLIIVLLLTILTVGVFSSNGWFPRTDAFSGKRYGWFGKELAKNAPNAWNPLAAPPPSPTPQLAKEYIYAGSRLLAVEDANANAAPPTDLAVWRPTTGTWYVLGGPGSQQTIYTGWGTTGDEPVEGDYDGDGKTDFAVFRASQAQPTGTWYIVLSSTSTIYVPTFGQYGDKPAHADYDGDGKTDLAVFRPSTNVWYVQGSGSGYYYSTWGEQNDKPASADYDGDGRADIAIWRPSTNHFYSVNSSNQYWQVISMSQSGEPVSTDYDGDGKADFAVFNDTTGTWKIRQSSTATFASTPTWGEPGDRPVPNDYDGDARSDLTIWRPTNGTWYIHQSATASPRTQQWGQAGDEPVPAYYRR